MATILLLGAGGQVGWELLPRLRALGEVVATVRSPTSVPELKACRTLDITDAAEVRAVVREVRPDAIVNAAAWTAVDKAESEPAAADEANATAPRVLAEEAQRLGSVLVHYSTDYVFDGSGERPWNEDDPTGPLNVYGRTKLAGEEAIRASGVPHLILRTSWVYGAHGNNFVKTMLRLGKQREELRVVCDQIGAPTSARVIANVTARLLATADGDLSKRIRNFGGTYHLACTGETSWHGFAEEIFRLATEHKTPLVVQRVTPIPARDYPVPAARPLNSRLDCRRIAERFGVTMPTWQAALGEAFPDILTAMSSDG